MDAQRAALIPRAAGIPGRLASCQRSTCRARSRSRLSIREWGWLPRSASYDRLRRDPGARTRQARIWKSRPGTAQPAVGGAAWCGKDAHGAGDAGHPAAADVGGGAGGDADLQRGGHAAARYTAHSDAPSAHRTTRSVTRGWWVADGGPGAGEISLAHRGCFSSMKCLGFNRRVLEVMQQPLEDKSVTISRAGRAGVPRDNFTLVAALNPCPCGYYMEIRGVRVRALARDDSELPPAHLGSAPGSYRHQHRGAARRLAHPSGTPPNPLRQFAAG